MKSYKIIPTLGVLFLLLTQQGRAQEPGIGYKEIFEKSLGELDAQFQQFEKDKDATAQKFHAVLLLGEQNSAEEMKLLKLQRKDEVQYSILEKEVETNRKKIDDLVKDIAATALVQFMEFEALYNKSQKKQKKVPSLAQLRPLLDQIKRDGPSHSGNTMPFSCLRKDFTQNKACLAEAIKFCRTRYGSQEHHLTKSSYDEDLNLEENKFETAQDALKTLLKQDEKKEALAATIQTLGGLIVGACGTLADEGYNFSETDLSFPNLKPPEWINAAKYRTPQDFESFNSICLPINNERRGRLALLQGSESISGWTRREFRDVLKTVNNECLPFIRHVCEEVEVLSDQKAALHYVTKSCEERAVTADDIKRDVAEWESLSIGTEASRMKHAELSRSIDFCATARSVGYEWRFKAPSLKGCKKAPAPKRK